MAVKKYVSLEKLSLYDEKIKKLISDADAAALASAKKYTDDSVKLCDAAGAANTAKQEAIAAAAEDAAAKVKALADGAVKTNTDAITAIKDGTIIDSFADVETALAGKQAVGDYATKTEAKGYADAKDTAIQAAQDAADAAQDSVDALSGKVGTVPDDKTVVQMIADAQTAATYDDTEIRGLISDNADDISALQGLHADKEGGKKTVAEEVQAGIDALNLGDTYAAKDVVDTLVGSDSGKSARTIANEELAKQLIPESAKESLDTLAEIAAWIQSHPDDASAMNTAIEALQNKVDTGDKTVTAYVTDAINALNIGDYAKATELTALAGRVSALETESAKHALKTEVEAVSTALDEYKDAHAGDYTNTQIDSAIKAVDDKVTALNDTYATDEELAQAISNEVTRANGAYAAKSLESTVQEHKNDTVVHITADERTLWNSALHASDIAIGSANGTISVKGADVAVKGLGSAAYTESSAYDVSGAAAAVDAKLTTEKERAEAAEAALGARIDEFVECSQEDINNLFTAKS